MTKVKQLPRRAQVKAADTWDLSTLFPNDDAWESAFTTWEARIGEFDRFRGELGTDAGTLAACLDFDNEFDRAGEGLGAYAFLKAAEDQANSDYQRMAMP